MRCGVEFSMVESENNTKKVRVPVDPGPTTGATASPLRETVGKEPTPALVAAVDEERARSIHIIQTLEDELRGVVAQLDAQQAVIVAMQERERDRSDGGDASGGVDSGGVDSEQVVRNRLGLPEAIEKLEQELAGAVEGDLLSRAAIESEAGRIENLNALIDAWSRSSRSASLRLLSAREQADSDADDLGKIEGSSSFELTDQMQRNSVQLQDRLEAAELELTRLRADRTRLDDELARLESTDRERAKATKHAGRSPLSLLRGAARRLFGPSPR
jgi:hypothetical protein